MINPKETWQVDVGGQIFESNFEGLVSWISEGSLLPQDKVRRGNLRWLEANKIPSLYGFFNAKELGQPMPPIQFSTTDAETETEIKTVAVTQNSTVFQPNSVEFGHQQPINNYNNPPPTQMFTEPVFDVPLPNVDFCLIHNDVEPQYICDICQNVFCLECPKSYGGNVKICPMCGSACSNIKEIKSKLEKEIRYQTDMSEGFGIEDFGRAIMYPFKYKLSLFFGVLFFMIFSLGQTAAGSGSLMMLAPVLICFMMANMLTFSVLANTVENFSQGKIDRDFTASFEDFSMWSDVIQPFFLSIGVFIVSFGLMTVLIIGAVWFMWNSVSVGLKKESDLRIEKLNKQKEELAKLRKQSIMDTDRDRAYQADLDNMNKQTQIQNLKSLGVADPESNMTLSETLAIAFRETGFLIIPIILSLLWGLFYYPIACAVAGYSRSFSATINPSIGLETIKLLGADYAKIVLITLFLSIIVAIFEFVFYFVLAPFDLPGIGNLPAVALGSIIKFYFSVVFAVVLGYALYKNADKLKFSLN
ncbi:hypothetical protein BH10ACI1_BH10ACI1_07920 [soil metagenome]